MSAADPAAQRPLTNDRLLLLEGALGGGVEQGAHSPLPVGPHRGVVGWIAKRPDGVGDVPEGAVLLDAADGVMPQTVVGRRVGCRSSSAGSWVMGDRRCGAELHDTEQLPADVGSFVA